MLVDERDRMPIGPISIIAHDGRILTGADLHLVHPEDLGLRADGTRATPARKPDLKVVAS